MNMRNPSSPPERSLRSAVADLARLSADDIEAIWYALSDAERQQLHPLLANATAVLSRDPRLAAAVLHESRRDASSPAGESSRLSSHLARLAGHWPDELVALAIRHADDASRSECLAAMSDTRQVTLAGLSGRATLTARARDALLHAVRHDADLLPPTDTDDGANSPASDTWRRRLRRRFRRGSGA